MSSLYQSMVAVIEQYITPLAGRLGQQKYVIAIRDGFTAALPFMIIGSFMLVFIFPPLFCRYHHRICPGMAGLFSDLPCPAHAAIQSEHGGHDIFHFGWSRSKSGSAV